MKRIAARDFCGCSVFRAERSHIAWEGENVDLVACPCRRKIVRLLREYKRTWGQGGGISPKGMGGIHLNPHPLIPEGAAPNGRLSGSTLRTWGAACCAPTKSAVMCQSAADADGLRCVAVAELSAALAAAVRSAWRRRWKRCSPASRR